MKQNNRQTSPFGRSTEEKQAGLSLPQPSLFTVDGNAYKYYNESAKNISKFILRLTAKKFQRCYFYSKASYGFEGWRFFLIPLESKIRLISFITLHGVENHR